MHVFSAILTLQIKQFHDHFIRITRMDFTLQENDSILEQ